MKVTRNRFPLITAGAIGVGAVLAFALPAGAAVTVQSQSPPTSAVTLGRTATLDANGAVVFAPVKVLCQPGSYTYLSVSVTENVGGDIASGTRSVKIDPCSGRQQSVRLAVTPTQKPFRKGVAFGQATLDSCDRTGCHTLFDEHNIQIVDR